MFSTLTEISRSFVVKFEDGTYLCQGNKAMKLYRKRQRAERALAETEQDGEVVEVSIGVKSYDNVQYENVDVSGIRQTLLRLAESLPKAHQVDVYKSLVVQDGGANIIRFTPLGEKPVREPGDTYSDIELHLQLRVQH